MTDRNPAHSRYVGRPLPRFEDLRLVRGRGRFTDDFALPDQVFAVFVRSPHAHARIRGIDTGAAKRAPGVLAVLTGADYLADGCKGIRHGPVPRDTLRHDLPAFTSTAERPILDEPHFPVAIERVRHVGEAVAVVIAETLFAARDAAERIEVEYEPLPAVTDVREAIAAGTPLLWDAARNNIALIGEFGDRAATERAFAAAEIVIEHEFRSQRIVNAQMEPRAAIGSYDAKTNSYMMTAGSQGAVRQREYLAAALNVPLERVHVVCPDVGGGFGPRSNIYAEQVVVTWAARRVGRPVRWTSDRSEAFLTDYQGRDSLATVRIALDKSGRIRALEADILFNVGGLPVSYVPLSNAPRVIAGVYDIAAAHVRVRGVMTNSAPTAPYRGAGRPEATFIIERLLDIAAKRLGIDRIELRRRNLIARTQFPYRAATGINIDSGDFLANMTQALALADWAGFAKRRESATARGRLAGIGLANYIESPVGAPHERVQASVLPEGIVEVVVGTQSTGQGHETSFAQVMADELGVTPDLIRFVTGDTRRVSAGGGSHSDRSMRFAGALMLEASRTIRDRAREAAASLLEADAASLVFANGLYQVPGSNRSLSLFDITRAIEASGAEKLSGEASFTGRMPTHPTGAAICELEVDPETGAVEIVRYTSVDDVGQPINPLILHGQVHGGIAQGIGQALFEGAAHEPGTGQVLTGSFMDYALPRADTLPNFEVALAEDPTSRHPLRVKGGGESGITPSLACVMNALFDALAPLGVTDLEMPATPARVWEAIRRMRTGGVGELMPRFISENDLENFERWLEYQGSPIETLSPGEIADWRQTFDQIRKTAGATSKVGLIKLRQVPGEYRYAVAVRENSGLWLTLWIRRNKKGEVFVMIPRGDRKWDPHASYHIDGTLHHKSYNKTLGRTDKRQPLTAAFRGSENIGAFGGQGPKGVGAICKPSDYTEVIEVPQGILGPRDGAVMVDLVEPECDPVPLAPGQKLIRQAVFKDMSPWLVVRVFS